MSDTSRYERYLAHYRRLGLTGPAAEHVAATLARHTDEAGRLDYDEADHELWTECKAGEPRARELYAVLVQASYPGAAGVYAETFAAGGDPAGVLAERYGLGVLDAREVAFMLDILGRDPQPAA